MRLSIPNRRESEHFVFNHNHQRVHGSVSYRRGDWAPIEVFLDVGKIGSDVQAAARDSAVAASLALQFGVPLATLRAAMTRLDEGNAAAGPLGHFLDLIHDGQS